jgi:hypothetical protein
VVEQLTAFSGPMNYELEKFMPNFCNYLLSAFNFASSDYGRPGKVPPITAHGNCGF